MSTGRALEAELDGLLDEDIASVIEKEKTCFDRLTEPLGRSIVLFGAGNLGRKILTGLRKVGIEPLAFADNNRQLWDKSIDGIKILSPGDAVRTFGKQAAFVIAVWSPGPERRIPYIAHKLSDLGCKKVVSFVPLFWKYPSLFLPHCRLDLPHKIYKQADDIRKAFSLLTDDDSRFEYLAQLKWLLSLDFGELKGETAHETYLPDEIFTMSPKEVFIDCGAFDGDTIKTFLRHQGNAFKRIVAFEPDPVNFTKLQCFVSGLANDIKDRITLLQAAASARREILRFEAMGTVSSAISDAGALEVQCVPLDEVFTDCTPTYIKMDIEGAEPDALAGARKTIKRTSPALAVCVYHVQDHLWRLPLLMQSLSAKYHFSLRRYGDEFGDVVCYAVPDDRMKKL